MPDDDRIRAEPTMQELAASYHELPAMPAAVADVLVQLASPDWTIAGIEATISADPALVARMIGVSNSALYGGGQEFRTLNQALVRLGFRAIRSLAVVAAARALFPMADDARGQRGQELWRHCAACGWAGRMVAEAVKQPDPDDAFAAGALHDVGKAVILLNRFDEYERILALMRDEGLDSCTAERSVLGVDHTTLAAWLMDDWHLPESVVGSITGHHDPGAVGEHERPARILTCGNLLAHLFAGGPAELRTVLYDELKLLGLKIAEAEDLTVEALHQLADMGDLV
ncbi:MAG: HDOD domain-containing protein [bacterium]|nr:HDOD domain-containing protein [bacterium]